MHANYYILGVCLRNMCYNFAHDSASHYGLPGNAPLKVEFAFCYLMNRIPTDTILGEIDIQNIAPAVSILKSVANKLHN